MSNKTTTNMNQNQCYHFPCGNESTIGDVVTLFLNRDKIVDRENDTAICIKCGQLLRAPSEYYSVPLLFCYIGVSLGIGFIVGEVGLALSNIYPQYLALWFVCAYGVFYCLAFIFRRLTSSVVLSLYRWSAFDEDHNAHIYLGPSEGTAFEATTPHKKHCRLWNSRRRASSHIGVIVIYIMFATYLLDR